MSFEPNGELIPVGGGDTIQLVRPLLTIGRRASCDICLHFPNVSGMHCELVFLDGSWVIRDLNSTNGIKVNGTRTKKKVLRPGDTISIAKRQFRIEYAIEMGRQALAEFLEETEDEFANVPLLEKAGLTRQPRGGKPNKAAPRPADDDDDDELFEE
jgi:pSer/pThr/pTyr-binding forkhead associated (FHA) protein